MELTQENLEALNNGFSKIFQGAFDKANEGVFWQQIATEVRSNAETEDYGWLTDWPEMREWVGDRVIKELKSRGYQISNRLWEATVGVERIKIEKDNIGIYKNQFEMAGVSAARKPQSLILDLIKNGFTSKCYDGQNFFDTDHPIYANHDGTGKVKTVSNFQAGSNDMWVLLDTTQLVKPFIYQIGDEPEFTALDDPKSSETLFMRDKILYGVRAYSNAGYGLWQTAYASKAELSADNYEAAVSAMGDYAVDGGRKLGISPNLILVSSGNYSKAKRIFKAMTGENGSSNVNYGECEILKVAI